MGALVGGERWRGGDGVGVMMVGDSRQALCMQRASSGAGSTYPEIWEGGKRPGSSDGKGAIDSLDAGDVTVWWLR